MKIGSKLQYNNNTVLIYYYNFCFYTSINWY